MISESRAAIEARRAEAVEIVVGSCPSCGELWPACSCGRITPAPPSVTDGGDETPAAPLVEWVQWRGKKGLSLYHVRVTSSGWLLCGRRIPADSAPAADSFAPVAERCAVCVRKLS